MTSRYLGKKAEQAAEDIALILLSFDTEEVFESVAHRATDMAQRAFRGWWELPGDASWNARMKKLRAKLPKTKRNKRRNKKEA
jgi:hypothetical protein